MHLFVLAGKPMFTDLCADVEVRVDLLEGALAMAGAGLGASEREAALLAGLILHLTVIQRAHYKWRMLILYTIIHIGLLVAKIK